MVRILVTGATGYVGGRLVPRLLDAGHKVRVLVRDPARIQGRSWSDRVEVVRGDLLDADSLVDCAAGCEAAYYLVHAMGAGAGFADRDVRAASNFAAAAGHLKHCIYLGGLMPPRAPSEHLRSRAETGEVLAAYLPTTEFRAGPIVGSGSLSFEMVRYLTERLPVMVAPRWIDNQIQPIAIRDVLDYLVEALAVGPSGIVEIGGECLTFRDMMMGYAAERKLTRRILPVPVLTPHLSGLWVQLVTPISNRSAMPLIQGITEPLVADGARAKELFPNIRPVAYREAVRRALAKLDSGTVETQWSGALAGHPAHVLEAREGLVRETRTRDIAAPPETVYHVVASLGGNMGWLAWNWAWTLRGRMDRVVGGPGLRRGRRHPHELHPGEAVDFWRVEAADPPRLLRLRAEMKLPGRAWLEWQIERHDGQTRLSQVALFAPKGLAGHLYWNALHPVHGRIFSDLALAVAQTAEKAAAEAGGPGHTAK